MVKGFVYMNYLNPVAELDGAGNVTARFVHGYKDGGNVRGYLVIGRGGGYIST